jgi:hypothetical protein
MQKSDHLWELHLPLLRSSLKTVQNSGRIDFGALKEEREVNLGFVVSGTVMTELETTSLHRASRVFRGTTDATKLTWVFSLCS